MNHDAHSHLSTRMVDILYYLALNPQPIHSRELAKAVGLRYMTVSTLRPLIIRGFIESSSKGWTITEDGKLKCREEMQAGR